MSLLGEQLWRSPYVRERSAASAWYRARGERDYPPPLIGIEAEPEGLWIRSDLRKEIGDLWRAPRVAIVGARAASGAGLEIARTIAWELARAGVIVVSGLARGIDSAAHEGALLGGGLTIAVLACGLDRCYPPEHAPLAERIARRGALISEWPAGTPPTAWRFPRRNRLISGLATAVLLVEAEAKSGALHTVRFAHEQGREVCAVPRDPITPGSVGPNRLIRDGALPVAAAADILHALQLAPAPRASRRGAPAAEGLAGRMLQILATGQPLTGTALAARLRDVPAQELMANLVTLEVEGRIGRDCRGAYRLREGV